MYGKSTLFSRVARISSVRSTSNSTKKLLEFLAEMPKVNSGRIAEAQRQRQQISRKSEKYGPSTVYLQVIGSGARGVPNTLYLFTDQKRYLFNCGECTQRLAHEHKIKLSRLDHIFITSKSWKNIGGLPGLSLTLQDVGVPNITLHGPEGMDELYNATKRFVIMKDMNVTMAKCSPSEDFEDNVMSVKYVLLGQHDDILVGKDLTPAAKKPRLDLNADKEFDEFSHDNTDYYQTDVKHKANQTKYLKDKAKPKPSPEKDLMKKKTEKVLLELQKKTNCSVAYICTLKKRLGTLDLEKCVELGVKPGPMLGQLKSGHDVLLPDGRFVLSKDVKTPDDPGPVFIVLEVPEISYLKESEFSAHFDNGINPPENIPTVVVHYTPPHVLRHPTYRSFMQLFGPGTRHLVLNTQNTCLGSEAVHRTQHKLHLLDPDIFPLLKDASVPAVWDTHPVPATGTPVKLKGLEELKNKIALAQFQNIINIEGLCKGDGGAAGVDDDPDLNVELMAGRTLTMFHLRPKKQLDRTAELKLHIQDYIQETMNVDGFVDSLQHFRRLVDLSRYDKNDAQKEYPKVVFLGTGSCIPSKTRNTSGIVLHIDENRSMLLDCGEGTYGQLVRFYGSKKINSFLRTLKAIYISHLHADHHIGLIGVLQARRQAFEEISQSDAPEPVYLLAPGQIVTWLSLYDHKFERIKTEYTLIANQNLIQDCVNQNADMTSAVLCNLGIQGVRTCLVSHCPNAFGVAIEVDDRNKITYSGDTIPCDNLVEIGDSSTLLIHEATMEDDLAMEARIKMHSTTTQAIDIGRRMNARYTVLTHFSQRYARLPRLNANILHDNNSVGIAFDNMQITMSDLELLPLMYAPLQLMFAEHCIELEQKAAHRANVKERRASTPTLPIGKNGDTNKAIATCTLSPYRVAALASPSTYRRNNTSIRTLSDTCSFNKNMQDRGKMLNPSIGIVFVSRSKTLNAVNQNPAPSRDDVMDIMDNQGKGNASSLPDAPDARSRILNTVNENIPPSGDDVMDIMDNQGKKNTPSLPSARTLSDPCSFNTNTQDRGKTTSNSSLGIISASRSRILNTVNQNLPPSRDDVMDIMDNQGKRNTTGLPSDTVRNNSAPPRDVLNTKTKQPNSKDIGRVTSNTTTVLSRQSYTIRKASAPIRDVLNEKIKQPIPKDTRVSSNTASVLSKQSSPPTNNLQTSNGYGKPIVTSHKRFPVRDGPHQSPSPTKTDNNYRSKNTNKLWNVENEKLKSPDRYLNQDRLASKSKLRSTNLDVTTSILIHIINWRIAYLGSCLSRIEWLTVFTIIAVGVLFWTATSGNIIGNKLRKSNPNVKPVKDRTNLVTERERPERKSWAPVRDVFNERIKQPFSRDIRVSSNIASVLKRQNSMWHSNRSFMPQLEDIKSSYLLLNNISLHQSSRVDAISKPKPLNENERREQLNEIKKKFRSKQFLNNARYEKIEGLNWISWK